MLMDLERALRKIVLFAEAPEAVMARLARACICREFEAGQEIVGYLDTDTDVYFVLSGRANVRIYSPLGKVVALRQISAGDIFGEFSALDGAPRSASVEAEAATRVAVLPAGEFRRLVDEVPQVSRALTTRLVQHLRTLTARVVELSTLAVNDRIHAELLRMAQEQGRSVDRQPNKIFIDSAPTPVRNASRISTHREAVTRHLKSLSRQGIVSRTGRSLVIEDMRQLTNLVREATTKD